MRSDAALPLCVEQAFAFAPQLVQKVFGKLSSETPAATGDSDLPGAAHLTPPQQAVQQRLPRGLIPAFEHPDVVRPVCGGREEASAAAW
jgi:hypothetical protein